jgi:hypothetical protein
VEPRIFLRCLPVLAIGLSVQGCGTTLLASRSTNPVIQDFAHRWLSNDSVLSTTASRRLALMSHRKDDQGKNALVICAEPPPDVGETFAKALAAQLEASAPTTGGQATIRGGFDDRAATAIAPLMARTQGLQILRDSAFTLCVDYMNGWIKDPETYMRIKEDRFNKAIALIEKELPHLTARIAPSLTAPQLSPAASAPMSTASSPR